MMKKSIHRFAAAAMALLMAGTATANNWKDVDYVGDGLTGHKLDIYTPDDGQPTHKVVVLIYGSAWFSNNSKADAFKSYGQQLIDAGFAVVSINHRASTEAKFPAQIQDVKAAIRYVRGNASKYGLDTSFIGITGYSSGGHLFFGRNYQWREDPQVWQGEGGYRGTARTIHQGEQRSRCRGGLVWTYRHEPHGALRDI